MLTPRSPTSNTASKTPAASMNCSWPRKHCALKNSTITTISRRRPKRWFSNGSNKWQDFEQHEYRDERDVTRRQHIIQSHSPPARKPLALPDRPGLGDVEQPEQDEDP